MQEPKITARQREDARFRIVAARTGLIAEQPFFGVLALNLIPVEAFTVPEPDGSRRPLPAMATDGIHLIYNPLWVLGDPTGGWDKLSGKMPTNSPVENITLEKVKGVICHEVGHVALSHHLRRDDRDHTKWNHACDYAVNPIVVYDAGMRLPEGVLLNPAFAGMSAERIYDALPQSPGKGGGKGQGSQGKGQGGQQGKGGQQSKGSQPPGEVLDFPNPDDPSQPATQAQKDRHETQWELNIRQAREQARAAGKMPAGLSGVVKDILEPKVPWHQALRQFIERLARNDYNWFPPNRRHLQSGYYFPSVRNMEILHGVLAIDTSGSTIAHRRQFAGELNGILEAYPTELTVVYCDARAYDGGKFTQEDLPIEFLEMAGGGGTRFAPVFEWVEENYDSDQGPDPGFMIYLTDLEVSSNGYPEEAPPYPVLWVKTPNGRGTDPPWGELVRMGA